MKYTVWMLKDSCGTPMNEDFFIGGGTWNLNTAYLKLENLVAWNSERKYKLEVEIREAPKQ